MNDGSPSAAPDPERLGGVKLEASGVEVQRSRANVFSRLFGGEAAATKVGRFSLIDRVGAGGMGVVYAAYDPQLDRKVAIKVLRSDVAGPGAAHGPLLAEARAMAKLSHPNVISVFEVGLVGSQAFVAMEFVEGTTLGQWLRKSQATDEILEVFVQAGEGLAAAHRSSLVHRDFKPDNVLVPADGGPVRVTDFGLAAELDTGAASSEHPVGTPAYMAPEQLRGQSVDARADQFAFAVALFEALTGHRPYDDASLRTMHEDPDFDPPPPRWPSQVSAPRP